MRRWSVTRWLMLACVAAPLLLAADKPGKKPADEVRPFELSNKWAVLVSPTVKVKGRRPLAEKGLVENFDKLKFTGPRPGHPFVLGEFVDDGDFALVNGNLERVSGTSAAIQFPEADQFELEGMMELVEYGGWFFAVGWNDGRGYVLSNVTMKESGSPWFLTELRGGTAIPEGTENLQHYEWTKTQPFRLRVINKELTLEVGSKAIVDHAPIPNYEKGRVLLGVYDGRYGPRKLRVTSLRMRSVEDAEPAGEKPAAKK